MKQEISWAGGYHVRGNGLVGQVFFPTNSSRLDPRDLQVLGKLGRDYIQSMAGRRIELACIGHADARGNSEYNQALGNRRAKVVQEYLKQKWQGYPLFSCQKALSEGEAGAVQKNASMAQMAESRRVDILSSIAARTPTQLPPVKIVEEPLVRRCTYRFYSSSIIALSGGGLGTGGSMDNSSFDEFFKAIMGFAATGNSADTPVELGKEAKQLRRPSNKPMTQRVNQIRIEIREVFYPGRYGGSSNLGSEAKVYYKWGKPLGLIEVRINKTYEDKFAKTSKKSPTKSQFILRMKVADNQFFFPPDP